PRPTGLHARGIRRCRANARGRCCARVRRRAGARPGKLLHLFRTWLLPLRARDRRNSHLPRAARRGELAAGAARARKPRRRARCRPRQRPGRIPHRALTRASLPQPERRARGRRRRQVLTGRRARSLPRPPPERVRLRNRRTGRSDGDAGASLGGRGDELDRLGTRRRRGRGARGDGLRPGAPTRRLRAGRGTGRARRHAFDPRGLARADGSNGRRGQRLAGARVTLGPAQLEVIRQATIAVAEEMKFDLMRTARSPVLREAGDLSCALTDASGRTVAQGHDIPMHLGVLSFTVQRLLETVPSERLAPGDVYFTNLPACGGNHLPDVKAVRPVFADGDLAAFAVALAHWPDIGGARPGSYVPDATEIYHEGLVIPPTRLLSAVGACEERFRLVLANVRGAAQRRGDIQAQAATTSIADKRLQEVFAAHGLEAVREVWERMQDESEQRVRRALAGV